MAEEDRGRLLVVGVGNELRGDDGAGLLVARRVRDQLDSRHAEVRELGGEPGALLDAWHGRGAVIVSDTIRTGSPPGTIRRLDASRAPLPGRAQPTASTHGVGLEAAIELARALQRLPATLIVYGLEGARFDTGSALSPEVFAAIPRLAARVLDEARALLA